MNDILNQFGPDAPIHTNDKGGKQSLSPVRCDLLPPKAILETARVLKIKADKYGVDNWRGVSRADHLTHAACRLLFALETK